MEKTHEIDESPQLKLASSSSFQPRNPPLNKYALACAVLASANSILLGYGKFPISITFSSSFIFPGLLLQYVLKCERLMS